MRCFYRWMNIRCNLLWNLKLNITIKSVYIICVRTGNFFMVQSTTSFYLTSNNSIGTATKKRCPLNLNFLPVFLRSRNHLRTFYERMIKLFLTRYLYVWWTRFAQWTQPETGTSSIFYNVANMQLKMLILMLKKN